jgi:hypothetical protein
VASAADRAVLMEDFNAVWCGPCHTLADTLAPWMDQHSGPGTPNDVVIIQEHINSSDPYWIPWGHNRFISYGNSTYIPDVWIDGVTQIVGSTALSYFTNAHAQRMAVPTNVNIQLGGQRVTGNTYEFTARVWLDAGSNPKPMIVSIVRVLDHYPFGYTYYRNCLREAAADVFYPGMDTTGVERTVQFTLDADSASHLQDVRIVAIAQLNKTSGPREVYNARMIQPDANGNFPILPPLFSVGDLNCDDSVNFGDINPFVMALSNPTGYGTAYPNCDITLGDINEDGSVNFGDINPFVTLLSGG